MEQATTYNLEELLHTIGSRKDKGGRIFLLFCGDVDKVTGKSWCPDCVKGKHASPSHARPAPLSLKERGWPGDGRACFTYSRPPSIIFLHFILFYGSAGPVIDQVLKEFDSPEDLLIRCTVGTREMQVYSLLTKGWLFPYNGSLDS